MKCEIVRDLLPLYCDNVCSAESRAEVEAHLKECAGCRREMEELRAPLPEEELRAADKEASALKRLSREWERGKWKAKLRGAAIAAAVCAVIVGAFLAATQGFWFPVDPKNISITNVRQLSDGRVVYHMSVNDDKAIREIRFEFDEEGNAYFVPKRALYTEKRTLPGQTGDSDLILDLPVMNGYARDRGYDTEITRAWYGRGEDAVLLWEEGMELPRASVEDEINWGDRN
ncbi:zf-HC2 domain-containing protein [Oscillibacter sp. MSJ-2]|uniref:Zf-HC2 domain-containing protein n=1 Tax=Dysosmobacter acutus TaxID=2841504 RepID=A0ABS6FEX9_9FIRM|nr:zf-HC2 domain-containing protein [Dysosmobacter acutus]MBU5627864.1 zf-HC2 domain-containing protein [Dysosmobacter acutus]